MRYVWLILGLAGTWAAWGDSAFVDFDSGLIFPQKLAGMTFERVEKYDSPELGYSVFYALDGGFSAEVSVFNLGREKIETGHKGDGIDVVFQGLEVLQERRKKNGEIAKLKKRGSTEIPRKGAIRFANRVYQYAEPRAVAGRTNAVTRIQSVYVTAAHNHFFKVEFLFDIGRNTEAREMAGQLVSTMIRIIQAGHSDEELLLAACDAVIGNPSGYAGRLAARHVLEKVQTMGELEIYDAFFVWSDLSRWQKPKNYELLEAAYYAGMIRAILPQKLDHGGGFEAFSAMVDAYKVMRSKDQIVPIEQLEKWAAAPDRQAAYQQQLIDFNYVLR